MQLKKTGSKALYQLNADEIMWQRCRVREDFILYENAITQQNQTFNAENATLNAKVDTLISEKEALATENRAFKTEQTAWKTEREQLLAKLSGHEAKGNRE